MSFGEHLQNLIKEKGYSYRKVAMLSGVDHSYISRLVRNEKERPSPEILAKLAPHLGTTYESLMQVAGYLPESYRHIDNSYIKEIPLEMSVIPQFKDPTALSPFYVRDGSGRYVTIPKKFLFDGDFLWRVKGTSLPEDGIEEGDYVVIKKQPVTKIGEIILLQENMKPILKKVESYDDLLKYQTYNKNTNTQNIGVIMSSHRLHIKERRKT